MTSEGLLKIGEKFDIGIQADKVIKSELDHNPIYTTFTDPDEVNLSQTREKLVMEHLRKEGWITINLNPKMYNFKHDSDLVKIIKDSEDHELGNDLSLREIHSKGVPDILALKISDEGNKLEEFKYVEVKSYQGSLKDSQLNWIKSNRWAKVQLFRVEYLDKDSIIQMEVSKKNSNSVVDKYRHEFDVDGLKQVLNQV